MHDGMVLKRCEFLVYSERYKVHNGEKENQWSNWPAWEFAFDVVCL